MLPRTRELGPEPRVGHGHADAAAVGELGREEPQEPVRRDGVLEHVAQHDRVVRAVVEVVRDGLGRAWTRAIARAGRRGKAPPRGAAPS